jgi:hypothetical protein
MSFEVPFSVVTPHSHSSAGKSAGVKHRPVASARDIDRFVHRQEA